MLDEPALRDLIGKLYGAVDDVESWPDVLAGLAKHLGADSAILYFIDTAREGISFVALSRISQQVTEALKSHYKPMDIFHRVYAEAASAAIVSRFQFVGEKGGEPEVWRALGEVLARDGSSVCVIEFHRWGDDKPFDEASMRAYAGLSNHLKQAIHLQRRLTAVTSQRDGAAHVLDRLPVGVVLVDGRGRAVMINRVAKELIRTAGAISIDRSGHCRAALPDESAALGDMVAEVAADLTSDNRYMLVNREDGGPALAVMATPIGIEAAGAGRPTAMVFVCDQTRPHPTPADALSQLYGLTASEGRVLENLVQGHRPEDVAADLGVTINTIRTHLKNIYRKTEAQGQPELVRLVLTGPAPLAGPTDG